MSLSEKLTADMKTALKAKEKLRLSTVRMLLSAVRGSEKDLQRDLTETEEVAILSREAKRRRESITAFKKGGRTDLAAQEAAELEIVQTYLPEALDEAAARKLVAEAIAEIGATTKADFGKVMRIVMPKLKGRFDGKAAKALVQDALS